jgi:hypothetical protein
MMFGQCTAQQCAKEDAAQCQHEYEAGQCQRAHRSSRDQKNGPDADHMPDLTIQIATRAQWIKHTFEISL